MAISKYQFNIELLAGRELDSLARNLRYGYDRDFSEDSNSEDEGDEDGGVLKELALLIVLNLGAAFAALLLFCFESGKMWVLIY